MGRMGSDTKGKIIELPQPVYTEHHDKSQTEHSASTNGNGSTELTGQWRVFGRVLEKGTRRPLANATVYVVEQDTVFSTTKADGSYELRLSSSQEYHIGAVVLGFDKPKPHKLALLPGRSQQQLDLYVLPTVQMPVVQVWENRNEDKVGKTVISGKELEQVAGSGGDPLKAVQSLPGATSHHDGSGAPAMRGSRPGDNLYYVDGIPLSYIFHMGGFVSVFPAGLVSDFNIFASSFGPAYGDATGAVFDVALRNPRQDRLSANVNLSLVSSDFLVETPLTEKQSVLFSARRSYWDILLGKQTGDDGVSFQFPSYYDYLGKYTWDVTERDRIKIYMNGASDGIEFTVPDSADSAKKEPVLAGQSEIDVAYDNQSLIWESQLSGTMKYKLMSGHRKTRQRSRIGAAYDVTTYNERYYIQESLDYQVSQQHKLQLGLDYSKSTFKIKADGVNPLCTEFNLDNCTLSTAERVSLDTSFDVRSWDGFIKDRWNLVPDLVLLMGLRHSSEDYLRNSFTEPKLGLEWGIGKDSLFTLGWGKYHQMPEGRYILRGVGNPQLDSIEAEHSLIGFSHKLDRLWEIKSELYYKTFSNFVVADPVTRYANGAGGKSYGLELFIKRNSEAPLNGWLSLTLSRSERTIDSTGDRFPFDYDQPVIATWVANYRASANWHFGLKWRYHTGARYTPIVDSQEVNTSAGTIYVPEYGDINSERLPPYHRLDVRADRDFVFNRWKFNTYFEVVNLYNRCNVAGYSYNPDYKSKEESCQLPFLPYFGLEAQF